MAGGNYHAAGNLPKNPDGSVKAGPTHTKGAPKRKMPYTHAEFLLKMERHEFDVVDEYIKLFRHKDTQQRTKYEILKDLMSYSYSKRKQVEVTGEIEHRSLNISWNANAPDNRMVLPQYQTELPNEPRDPIEPDKDD